MLNTMPWYRSKIVIGTVISILSKVAVLSGLVDHFAPEDAEQLTNLIVLLGGGVGDLLALGARLTQKTAPAITLTK